MKIAVARPVIDSIHNEVSIYQSLGKDLSSRLVSLLESFEITGPNGKHLCLAFETMGPNLDALLWKHPDFEAGDFERRYTKSFAKKALRDVLVALDFLHGYGLIHGDLQPGNILVSIPAMETNPGKIEELQQSSDNARPLTRRDGKKDLWAPRYLLEPAPLHDYVSFDVDPLVKLADLGAGKSSPSLDKVQRQS